MMLPPVELHVALQHRPDFVAAQHNSISRFSIRQHSLSKTKLEQWCDRKSVLAPSDISGRGKHSAGFFGPPFDA